MASIEVFRNMWGFPFSNTNDSVIVFVYPESGREVRFGITGA